MARVLRVGIVGANPARGWAKDAHIPALKHLDGLQISAVSTRNRDTAEAAASAFGADYAFSDSLELARCPDVDLVSVTVKVPEHRLIVLEALAAGKHVYCEWPLGRNVAEAQEMAEAADRAGVHVMVGFQGLASPATKLAIQLISSGAIGRPQSVRVVSPTAGWGSSAPEFYRYLSEKENGATLADIAGGHTLALIDHLVGAFDRVEAKASILHPKVQITGSDQFFTRTCADHLQIKGWHHSGCISDVVVAGGQPPGTEFALEILGSLGTIKLTSNHPGGYQVGDLRLFCNGELLNTGDSVSSILNGPPGNVARLYLQLAEDILHNRRTVPDFWTAVKFTQLLEKIDITSSALEGEITAL